MNEETEEQTILLTRNDVFGAPSPLFASLNGEEFLPVYIHGMDNGTTVHDIDWSDEAQAQLLEEVENGEVIPRVTNTQGQRCIVLDANRTGDEQFNARRELAFSLPTSEQLELARRSLDGDAVALLKLLRLRRQVFKEKVRDRLSDVIAFED